MHTKLPQLKHAMSSIMDLDGDNYSLHNMLYASCMKSDVNSVEVALTLWESPLFKLKRRDCERLTPPLAIEKT
jgi:hypothetical protein